MIKKLLLLTIISIHSAQGQYHHFKQRFCINEKSDSFCVFTAELDYNEYTTEYIRMNPNIYNELSKEFIVNDSIYDYRVIIEFIAINERLFIDKLIFKKVVDPIIITKISSIIRSSCLRLIAKDYQYEVDKPYKGYLNIKLSLKWK